MPPSPESQLTRQSLQKDTSFSEGFSLEAERKAWEEASAAIPLPHGVKAESLSLANIHCEKITPYGHEGLSPLFLYFHGGGYNSGSAMTTRPLASALSLATQYPVLVPEYRLAPEHPYPAAVEDGCAVYQALLADGFAAHQIVIGGDSAGAGLVMSALLKLRADRIPLPAVNVQFSPWADLTHSGESMTTRTDADPFTSPRALRGAADHYAATHDPADPLLSTVFAELHDLPPMMIHAGEDEILLSDATRLADNARRDNVPVALHVWEGLWHCFVAWTDLPESRQALAMTADFVRQYVTIGAKR